MPLRDHLRPPVSEHSSWEGFHGMWPAMIVQHLVQRLPGAYSAEPRVHLGSWFEIDVCAWEQEGPKGDRFLSSEEPGGVATLAWAPPQPTLTIETDLTDQYEYEVRVYDQSRGRVLVAAVELVSPANKDRPENRRAFVTKCAALLQQDVCVSIVDLVTTRNFNLYVDLLAEFDAVDPSFEPDPPATYAVTCRGRNIASRSRLETWAYPLKVGEPLPTLPLWLSADLCVSLDLEPSYEDACRVLRIT